VIVSSRNLVQVRNYGPKGPGIIVENAIQNRWLFHHKCIDALALCVHHLRKTGPRQPKTGDGNERNGKNVASQGVALAKSVV
jgi:hypothetical protein